MSLRIKRNTILNPNYISLFTWLFFSLSLQNMVVVVGLDLSLTSPGVAIYDTCTKLWSLYGFAQRVREQQQSLAPPICLLPPIPAGTRSNEERYEYIRRHIVDDILSRYADEAEVLVGIEAYAFGAKGAGHSYKLQELGGVLKHSLWVRFPGWTQVLIPPTKWKKSTTGNGRATKLEVVEYVAANGPCLPLVAMLGTPLGRNGAVPSPAQDLADAVCIVLSLLTSPE
jgi:hypothetical protein